MELLVAQNISRLNDGNELLAGVNMRLAAGDRVGLGGPNGSGKSTLLRILGGSLQPDSGRVWRAPGVRLGYLPQTGDLPSVRTSSQSLWQLAERALSEVHALEARMRRAEERMAQVQEQREGQIEPLSQALTIEYESLRVQFERAGGYGATARLRRELAGFTFTEHDDDRLVETLSSGELRRLALAMTLASNPDVLLLDEPTNHLDIHARVQLTRRLSSWQGALVVISHDRALLDECTTKTAFLDSNPTGPSLFSLEAGNYSAVRTRRQAAQRSSHKRERERQRESERLTKMAAELATFGKKAAARKRGAERQLSKLRLAGVAPLAKQNTKPQLAAVSPAAQNAQGQQQLLKATGLTAEPVLLQAQVVVNRGQRIALLGPNGSGKSTLLALLAGERRSQDPLAQVDYLYGLRLRYLSQIGRGLQPEQTLWEQASARTGTVAAGRILAGAGLPASSWNSLPDQLSGGQRARAGLALALSESADIWLIDEPTNDLDLAAVEALEQQLLLKLEEGNSALLLATHDRRLAETLCTEVWSVVDGLVVRHVSVEAFLSQQTGQSTEGDEAGQPEFGQDSATEAFEPALNEAAVVATTAGATTHVQPEQGQTAQAQAAQAAQATTSREQAHLDNPVEAHQAAQRINEQHLEEQRAGLLRLRDEEPHLTERDRLRIQTLLTEVESQLMAAYEVRLPLPAPRYRLIEMGTTLYADHISEQVSEPRTAVVVPFVTCVTNAAQAAQSAQAAARALQSLSRGDRLPELDTAWPQPDTQSEPQCVPVWLEVRKEENVGHLRLVDDGKNTCATRHVRAALANAATRLAFTRLGVQVVQLHEAGPLPGSILKSAGDGWWTLNLNDFLQIEGWRTKPEQPPKRGRRRSRRGRRPNSRKGRETKQ